MAWRMESVISVGVEDGAAFKVSRGAAHGLDERAGRAQEAFLVGVENGDERDFGQVEAFAEQIDTDEGVEFAFAQAGEELDALEGFDFRVHVTASDADLGVVAGEVFGHALGEGGDEHSFVAFGAVANLGEQVVDLAFDGRISTSGSTRPVGRMTCSTTTPAERVSS